jgi:DNA-directed RNA polymerase specialized sigma24 family protein
VTVDSFLPPYLAMATSHTTRWWDRDVDEKGRRIRSDLRMIAPEIWDWACKCTQSRLGDIAPAAELMDKAIAQASAYLDKCAVPLNSDSHSHLTGLMRRCFWSVLQRQAKQLRRMELVGDNSKLSHLAADLTWSNRIESRIECERIVGLLSDKCRRILALRDAGYDWREIAAVLGTTPGAVKKSFLREIAQLQRKFHPSKRPKHK